MKTLRSCHFLQRKALVAGRDDESVIVQIIYFITVEEILTALFKFRDIILIGVFALALAVKIMLNIYGNAFRVGIILDEITVTVGVGDLFLGVGHSRAEIFVCRAVIGGQAYS